MSNPNLLDFLQWLDTKATDISDPGEFMEWYNEYSDTEDSEDEPALPEKPEGSLVEQVIYKFFKSCLEEQRLPTVQEAQTVALLDSIVSKYN